MPTIGRFTCIILLLCGLLLITPAMAGTRYADGSPELSAYISGSSEFAPGDDAQLAIVIENTGINEYKIVQSSVTDRDDLPNTAKFLTVTLLSGDAPIIIKSDPQMIGDLPGGSRTTATFTTKIPTDARGGNYTLPLQMNYSYLYAADQYGVDTIEYTYMYRDVTVGIPFRIKPGVSIDVSAAVPEHLNAGTSGYLAMQIANTGTEDGKNAVVRILRNGQSPIVPVDSSVYIGDFRAGSTVSCRYKVSVADSAEEQTYPIDVVVEYENRDGDLVTSESETIGIPIGSKTDFAIVSAPAEMHPGNTRTIDVEYKNTGGTTIYGARARISAVDPFGSSSDTAYIGTLAPNESHVVTYTLNVDRSATIKEYGLDSEIRYRDALDKTHISDIMKVTVNVTRPAPVTAILTNPIYLSIIAAAIIGIAYAIFHYRRRRQ